MRQIRAHPIFACIQRQALGAFPQVPSVVPSACQSGGAAALPGTAAGAAVRDTETLWWAAHGWNVAMGGYTVFRKNRWRRAWGVMPYIKELLDKCSVPVENCRQTC